MSSIDKAQRIYDRMEPVYQEEELTDLEDGPMVEDLFSWLTKAKPEQLKALARFIDYELTPADMAIFENWMQIHANK